MKVKIILSTIFFSCILFSCKKRGCTDSNAINFSANAKEDDGSCKAPEYLTIKSIELKVLKTTDKNGVEWDSQGLPDCFMTVSVNGIHIQTETVNDTPIGKTIIFNIVPNIVIKLDTLHEFQYIDFKTFDEDGTSYFPMATASVALRKDFKYYEVIGNSLAYHKRLTFTNGSNYNYNNVIMAANFEWE